LTGRSKYQGIYKDRQYESAFALYDFMGIDREGKEGRTIAMLRNWSFFDAPHAAFFSACLLATQIRMPM